MTIGSISRFVLAYKPVVVLAWLAVFILGVVLIGPVIDRLPDDSTTGVVVIVWQ